MKSIAVGILAALLPLTSFAGGGYFAAGSPGARQSEEISLNAETLESVTVLVKKTVQTKTDVGYRDLQVKVIVDNLGLSTDISPTKHIILALYSDNEMFKIAGSYAIGFAYKIDSIKRVDGGIYEITGQLNEYGETMTIQINAVDAVNEMKTTSCSDFAICRTAKPVKVIVK